MMSSYLPSLVEYAIQTFVRIIYDQQDQYCESPTETLNHKIKKYIPKDC